MPKFLSIQIPEPCGEKRENMSPTANGSYCHCCKKEVIDFTLMSDESVAAFFGKKPGNICGRFYPDQLNKEIPLPKKKSHWLRYFFTITLPAFLISVKSSAQLKVVEHSVALSYHKSAPREVLLSPEFLSFYTGRLIDKDGEPVEAASIIVPHSKRGTASDQNGIFKISIEPGDDSLIISGVGLVQREISIKTQDANNIIMERIISGLGSVIISSTSLGVRKHPMELGGAVITSYSVKTTSIRQNNLNDINIFPNPVHSGAELNIGWKEKVDTDQLIEVFDADGRLIQQETIHVTGKLSSASFILKSMRPGLYIIMAIDMKTGKKMSKEFIVE